VIVIAVHHVDFIESPVYSLPLLRKKSWPSRNELSI
jgi:hypothetical protein